MNSKRLAIVGAGCPEVVKLIAAINGAGRERWEVLGFLDDDPAKSGKNFSGYPVLGPTGLLAASLEDVWVVNNVAKDMLTRQRVHDRLRTLGVTRFATLIHPSVDTAQAEIGDGALINEGAVLGPETSVGAQTILSYGVVVGHESRVGDYCFLAAKSTVGARSRVGNGVLIGLHALVLPSRRVGDWSTVGAGSVVVSNVAPGATVFGNPARRIPQWELASTPCPSSEQLHTL